MAFFPCFYDKKAIYRTLCDKMAFFLRFLFDFEKKVFYCALRNKITFFFLYDWLSFILWRLMFCGGIC